MSADQSVIDLTNETQDDIEIVSQKLNHNDDDLIICKSTHRKRRLTDDLEIISSSIQRSSKNRRLNNPELIPRPNDGLEPSTSSEDAMISGAQKLRLNLLESLRREQKAEPIVKPGFQCPICIESHKDDLVSTTCGHIFCKPCIKEALKVSKACPKCRKKLTTRSFHSIYLD